MKKSLLFLLGSLWCAQVFGQSSPLGQPAVPDMEYIDSIFITRERWRDSLFRMDKSQVPTGYLLEYSLGGFEPQKYNGLGGNDTTRGSILMLHNMLWHSKVNSNAAITETEDLFDNARARHKSTGEVPLAFVYLLYNRIRSTALQEGLFTIASDSVGILDVPNRTVSPYDTHEFFAFGPVETSISQFNAVKFTLPQDLFMVPGINTVQIDFGDGVGFRTLSKGGNVDIYYATTGTKYLTAKITTASGIRTAKSQIVYERPAFFVQPDLEWKIQVEPVYTSEEQYLNSGSNTPMPLGDYTWSQVAGARVTVENGCDAIFDKPIIIVEGFDIQDKTGGDQMKENFRGTTTFRETLKAYGYDLVYVDFVHNNNFIENNAKVLEAVINKVNQTKTGTYKSSVIGFSMGGLIARWCLKDMEDRGLDHKVENYFSYDSPQQGAYITLGMQYIAKEIPHDFPYARLSTEFRKSDDAFKSPAAKQMLVLYGNYNTSAFNWYPTLETLHPVRAKFAADLVAKGYPQQTHNYGIAFGRGNNTSLSTKDAGNGRQFTPANPFFSSTPIWSGEMSLLFASATTSALTVPENNRDEIARYEFGGLTYRKIFGLPVLAVITLRQRMFIYNGKNSYDEAPGGFEETQKLFKEGWKSGLSFTNSTTYGHDGHNFLSTVSALDLQNQNYNASTKWQSNNLFYPIDSQIQNPTSVTGGALSSPSLSPFEAVATITSDPNITTPSQRINVYHNGPIYPQLADFIERKILKAEPSFDCIQNSFCNVSPFIPGPNIICEAETFTLNGFTNGVNINWSFKYNAGLKITNGQGTNKVTIEPLYDTNDTLIATVTSACGISIQIKKGIKAGAPTANYYLRASDYVNNDIYCFQQNYFYHFSFEPDPLDIDAHFYSEYIWGYYDQNNNQTIVSDGPGNTTDIVFPGTGSFAVFMKPKNQCGTGLPSYRYVEVVANCGFEPFFSMTASPNPVSDELLVTIEGEETVQASQAQTKDIEFMLYNVLTSKLEKAWSLPAKQKRYILNVKGLKNGQYVLKAKYGKHQITKHLVKE